jgi:hypothetical protein
MLSCVPRPAATSRGTEFVAVQRDRVGLVVQAGTADVSGRGVLEEFFLDRVPVEPGDGAQAT